MNFYCKAPTCSVKDVCHHVSLWLFCQSSVHHIQGLQRGEITPGPGALHSHRVVEEVARKGQMEAIGTKSMVGQRLDSRPEVPEREIVIIGNLCNGCIDAVIAFQVICFGGNDRHRAVSRMRSITRRMYLSYSSCRFFRPPRFHADEDDRRFPDSQLTIERRFVLVAGLWVRAQRRKDRGNIEAAFDCQALARVGTLIVINRRLEIGIFIAEAEFTGLIKDGKKIGRNVLAITDDREMCGSLPIPSPRSIDRAHRIADVCWHSRHLHPGAFCKRRLGRDRCRGRWRYPSRGDRLPG